MKSTSPINGSARHHMRVDTAVLDASTASGVLYDYGSPVSRGVAASKSARGQVSIPETPCVLAVIPPPAPNRARSFVVRLLTACLVALAIITIAVAIAASGDPALIEPPLLYSLPPLELLSQSWTHSTSGRQAGPYDFRPVTVVGAA